MDQLRFLVIAPTQGTAGMITDILQNRDDIQADTFVAAQAEGVEIARIHLEDNYDAVIAWMPTAQIIRSTFSIPVIDIQISTYDILQAIKLAEHFQESFALVGSEAVTGNAQLLRELLQDSWEIYTVEHLNDSEGILRQMKERGIRLAVTGFCKELPWQQYGIKTVQITTSESNLTEVLDRAIKNAQLFRREHIKTAILEKVIQGSPYETVVCNEKGDWLFTGLQTIKESYVRSYINRTRNRSFQEGTYYRYDERDKMTIRHIKAEAGGRTYYAYCFIKKELPFLVVKNGMNVYSREEAMDLFLTQQNEVAANWRKVEKHMDQIVRFNLPVMIMGERGTGKEQLAVAFFAERGLDAVQYAAIDCHTITDKMWNYLIKNEESPLNESGWTFHFREVEELSDTRIMQLLTMIKDTSAFTHNQFIFSCTLRKGVDFSDFVDNLQDELNCIVLNIPPIRQRKDEIEQIAAVYLNSYNVEFAKQVSGFTEEALESMKAYSWPGNLIQFKRILMQLVRTSSSVYIQKEAVDRILFEEKLNYPQGIESLDLTKTLDEINYDIARAVTERVGNQAKAAQQLGICRTTLWRILNRK
ncbi:MAG: PrpR N-terminal domain-containing protein [Firmicutes bacterium]|nr:PrpR N-terminal domain-containing protein [Bacillota bacterium]